MFAKKAGIELVHVPYRGGVAALGDVFGGTIPAIATTLPNLVAHHKSGKLRILGFSGDKAVPGLPDVPTFKEQGYPELVIDEVFGLFASSKTPAPVQAELEKAIIAVANTPGFMAAIEKLEFDAGTSSSANFSSALKVALERWGPVIKATGYTAAD